MSRTAINTPVSAVRTRSSLRALIEDADVSVIGSSGDTGSMNRTPYLSNGRSGVGISHVKNLLEEKMSNEVLEVEDKSSPGLARLRMTPGGQLKQKQRILMKKHEETRKQADKLNVGGGITLWPEMEDMRLSQGEIIRLCLGCLGLLVASLGVFIKLHGNLVKKLWHYKTQLVGFSDGHPVDLSSQEHFRSSVVNWHIQYRKLLSEINQKFDMSRVTVGYQLYILLYIAGVVVLLYFLLDNMFSTNKLSPRRIKIWVSLLSLVGSWTVLMGFLLVTAQQVETAVEMNVLNLSEILGDVVQTNLSSSTFHTVLQYWRTKCLPPTTHGVLTILGVLPVRDVLYYLQYYSLPVIMALATPVVKLVLALLSVYNVNV